MRNLANLPKAHLHVHLESTLRPATLAELSSANGVDIPEDLRRGEYRFTGFADFFQRNGLVRDSLCRAEDFHRAAVEFCEDEAASGTRYAEVSFTAAAHGERVGDLDMPLASVLDGLAEGRRRFGIECRVILDHSRRRSVGRAWRTLDLAVRYGPAGVVGVGLAGDEAFPLAPFTEVFQAAAEAGLHIVHHAGEAEGADSIREAIGIGGARRIGHGIRILDDPDLVAEVAERRIPLEVCPSSNVALGFVPSIPGHPLDRLRRAGLAVTLSTDVPALVGTTLTAEYALVRDAFGYDDETLADLSRAGVDASFAPAAVKRRLNEEIDAWLAA
ncbi:adenosine deaminase [Rhizohabitans arisaemae]|uniref:adenosine deaminase n=1 Tax=Rhizohabitans arisaemae TaxID=2720610 RepID=UPI0024B1B2A2|nr:adenosine deaminase [Rhizohabitans arisaemae]